MTRPPTPPILSELRSASSPASQVRALRALRNEIIGHGEQKELWVRLGILTPLNRILKAYKGNGKRRYRDGDSNTKHQFWRPIVSLTEEEEALLEVIIIFGCLAHGGPAFLSPIYASSSILPLLSLLSPAESHPRIVLQALRTLNDIADSLALSDLNEQKNDTGLLNLLYTEQSLYNLAQLMLQGSGVRGFQEQIALTASLISKTCRSESQRAMLVQARVLEALAVSLAPWIISTISHLHGADEWNRVSMKYRDLPPITAKLTLSPTLHAIGTIVQHSRARCMQLLYAPALIAAFQRLETELGHLHERRQTWNSNSVPSHSMTNLIESLLPRPPHSNLRPSNTSTSGIPPLGVIGTSVRHSQPNKSLSSAIEVIQTQGLEYVGDEESPFIAWLIQTFRSSDDATSLMAAWLVALMYRQGLTKPNKEASIALLLVPSLVRMLHKDMESSLKTQRFSPSAISCSEHGFREQVPAVLAMLTAQSSITQKAAADADAIKRLSQLLKDSYDPIKANSTGSLWSPDTSAPDYQEALEDTTKLGSRGISADLSHKMKLRETVLVALAALASEKDEYRKNIIENGVIPYIIRALHIENNASTTAPQVLPQKKLFPQGQQLLEVNSRNAILAACGAARALSRSVSTLRTSLMDAGLATPLFSLLKCQDTEIQVAATAVICNLVLEFSPMRDAIIGAGIQRILCEHAHSVNSCLRLNSMWALKHLVVGASNEIKQSCLEELGPAWLKQIISDDLDTMSAPTTCPRHSDPENGATTPIRMSTPNAAGEQVDLLNAVEDESRNSSLELDDDGDEDLKMSDNTGHLGRAESAQKRDSSHHRNDRGPLRAAVGVPVGSRCHHHQGLSDDLAIQKEGFEFVRNLVCGPNASDMIDHVFRELGQDKVFDILAAKLRPRVLNAFDRDRRSAEHGVRTIQPQTDILKSVCYTLVHIAAGHPRHRQSLVSQIPILEALVPLFNHANEEVRACCAWIVINLTWEDNEDDRGACRARARKLADMGMMQKVQHMEHDTSLNCRERGKNAFNSIQQQARN